MACVLALTAAPALAEDVEYLFPPPRMLPPVEWTAAPPVVASPAFPPYDESAHDEIRLEPLWTPREPPRQTIRQKLWADIGNYYDRDTMTVLVATSAAHAVIANTNLDEAIREDYQEKVRGAGTDEWAELFHNPKVFGEGVYVLPTYAAAIALRRLMPEGEFTNDFGEWGERSLRASAVGASSVIVLQWAIGSSRPGEEHSESHWEPFHDNNGASGHAFMGAVPFLAAAKMTDRPVLKVALVGASTLPGLSRLNDDAHYASQIVLGWTIAYLATEAVDDSLLQAHCVTLAPGPVADGQGLNILWSY